MKSIFAMMALLLASHAAAEDAISPQEREWNEAVEAVQASMVFGASDIGLHDQGHLSLPEGYLYVPQPAADMYMHALGNSRDPGRVGLVMPANDQDNWFIDISYTYSGYVADDDAADWDVEELMQTILDGTEAANKDRAARGFPTLEISGWVERPDYDPSRHQLIWSIGARTSADAPGEPETINYNTYLLGREGYFELNLITSSDLIAIDKVAARTILDAVSYKEGKRYADFNPDTDHVAEYGLAALVTGVAAKKLGLLAAIGAFLAKFSKVLIIGGIALLGGLKSILGKKDSADKE